MSSVNIYTYLQILNKKYLYHQEINMDIDSKDIDILTKIKDLDDRLMRFHSAEMFFHNNLNILHDKINDIDKNIQTEKNKLNDLYTQIDSIQNDILECKKNQNDLLVEKTNASNPDFINHINENIDILKLKIQLFNNQIDDLNNNINKQQQHIDMLENDKQFFLKNNNHSFEKNSINNMISEINISKRKLMSMLSNDTLKEYNELFALDKHKMAINNIIDGFCGGCHLLTTLQQQEAVLQHNTLVNCEYCGCFLVNTENNVK
jgi:predicted  nucleic acid-binding Zn-ribbon protein